LVVEEATGEVLVAGTGGEAEEPGELPNSSSLQRN